MGGGRWSQHARQAQHQANVEIPACEERRALNGFVIHLLQAPWCRVGRRPEAMSSPKLCVLIGPQAPHCLAPMAGSGLICTSSETRLNHGTAPLQALRHESPLTELPGRIPVTGRGSHRSCMPVPAPPVTCGWRWSMRLFQPYATRPEQSGPCICASAWWPLHRGGGARRYCWPSW